VLRNPKIKPSTSFSSPQEDRKIQLSERRIDALWAEEAEKRIDAFERGEMAAIPAKDLFAEIKRIDVDEGGLFSRWL
jgi:hypothetical protein